MKGFASSPTLDHIDILLLPTLVMQSLLYKNHIVTILESEFNVQ